MSEPLNFVKILRTILRIRKWLKSSEFEIKHSFLLFRLFYYKALKKILLLWKTTYKLNWLNGWERKTVFKTYFFTIKKEIDIA